MNGGGGFCLFGLGGFPRRPATNRELEAEWKSLPDTKSHENRTAILEPTLRGTVTMKDRIVIFDTTLRDGEQCPGASMNLRQKMEIARQLARLKVDVIEAGFPVISDGDFEAVQAIAKEVKGPIIAGLARCVAKDIEAAGKAVKPAGKRGRIHVFLATSKIHREFKLGKPQDEIVRLAAEGVALAKTFVSDVEFSPEDGSRTEPEFLVRVCKAVVAAGATTVNIPTPSAGRCPSSMER